MKRKILSTFFALVLALTLGLVSAVPAMAAPDAWYVDGAQGTDNATQGTGPGADAFATIQYAIDDTRVVADDTINVAAGTYTEDLTIDVSVTLQGEGSENTTIKGVDTLAWGNWPLPDPNIDILASGVKIHGFTIESPAVPDTDYSSGMVIDGTNVEIYNNEFVSTGTGGAGCVAIQTYRDDVLSYNSDISGLNIHHNEFSGTLSGGWVGVFINHTLTGTGTVTVQDNDFSGTPYQGVVTERDNTVISGNDIITDMSATGYGIIVMDWDSRDQDNVQITGNTIKGSSGFAEGIRIGPLAGDQTLTNISITNNTIQGNAKGIRVRSSADGVVINYNDIVDNTVGVQNDDAGVELDATNNWWGDAAGPTHAGNTFNYYDQGDEVSDYVDYCPWLDDVYATGASFAPVTSEDGDFSSIQAAIDAATSTTVTCKAGAYDESLSIDKSLTVQSEDGAITEGVEWDVVTELYGYVEIELGWDGEDPVAETAIFDGFYMDGYEIYISAVNNGSSLTISNNVLDYYDSYGIYCGPMTVDNGSSVTIEGNALWGSGVSYGIEFSEVAGDSKLTIRDNQIFWNDVGIYIAYVAEASTVTIEDDNLIAENYYGIEFGDVDGSTVTIAGNTIGEWYSEEWDELFSGNAYAGIYFGGEATVSSNITIGGDTREEGNVIVGNGSGESPGGIHFDTYLEASSLEILNNDILDNIDYGVFVFDFDEASTVDIHYNSIVGNSYGVSNYDSSYLIDATCNWWGDVAGPTTYTNPYYYNYELGGDEVSSGVDYIPWLIQSELAKDWNIWSRPIAPDEDSWEQMKAELVEDGVKAFYFYYFDVGSSTQVWGTDPDEAGPLDAFYIKMPAESRIRYCINDEATFPGQKEMKVGWNFIGLTELYDMEVLYALYDIYYGTGQTELAGYSRVISPSLNGESGSWICFNDSPWETMYPTEGYWVFMVNDGTLGGFTETPIVEVENGY